MRPFDKINQFTGWDSEEVDFEEPEKTGCEVVEIVARFFDCAVRNVVSHESFTAGELPSRLDQVIEDTFQITWEQKGRMECVAKGIALGILRSRKLPEREIRSALEATASLIVAKVMAIGGDVEEIVQGYVEGILQGAAECGLDGPSCAAVAARGAVMSAYSKGGDAGDVILDLVIRWMSSTGLIYPKENWQTEKKSA